MINILKTEAIFGQVTKELYLRTATGNDGNKRVIRWYYDLTNEKWECVEISEEGWKVKNDIALFKRYASQIAQVISE